jgi:hypothetical protein
MVWTTIPNTDIDADSAITVALMTALRDNTAAAFGKEAGSPELAPLYVTSGMLASGAALANISANSIGAFHLAVNSVGASEIAANACGQSELAASSVGQSELKRGTHSLSAYFSTYTAMSPAGGSYTMAYFLGGGSAAYEDYFSITSHATTYSPQVGVSSSSSVGRTAYLYSLYVQASPPYDLGNGDIPVFIYLLVAKAGNTAGFAAGKIMGTSVCVDPSWAYHGADALLPKNKFTGADKKEYERVRRMPWTSQEAFSDVGKMRDNISAIANPVYDNYEVDMARKIRNQANVPHPFMDDVNLPHCQVVMADPHSELAKAAYELVEEENHGTISEMISHPSLVIGTEPISGLIMPPSVMGVSVSL